jgi:chromate reductase
MKHPESEHAPRVNVLAVCGRLRASSKNRSLLEAAQLLAPPDVAITFDWSLATLPHYNPDLDTLDGLTLPAPAAEWRARVAGADELLISSPEYAHGIPGVLKNALDWLVSSTDFPGKPVALLSASAMSEFAPAQLREILVTVCAYPAHRSSRPSNPECNRLRATNESMQADEMKENGKRHCDSRNEDERQRDDPGIRSSERR